MLSLFLLGSSFAATRVDICHWDDEGYATVITVASPAVAGHFGHGDSYPSTYYADLDGDGHGDPNGATDVCPNEGFSADATDCDDADPYTYGDAPELDDLVDNDCDVWVDEDFVAEGDVILTEIARQPWVGYTWAIANAQWFEIANVSDRTVDLSKWYIVRTYSALSTRAFFVDPDAQLQLAPGDHAVFCKTDNFEGDPDAAYPLWCDYFWGDETQAASWAGTYGNNTFTLARDTDRLAMYIEGGSVYGRMVDDVRWTWTEGGTTNWPRTATYSMTLDPSAYDTEANDLYSNWCLPDVTSTWWDNGIRAEHGTPGMINDPCW